MYHRTVNICNGIPIMKISHILTILKDKNIDNRIPHISKEIKINDIKCRLKILLKINRTIKDTGIA